MEGNSGIASALLTLVSRLVPREQLPESAYMHQLLGLNLLFLLSQNRVAEFHTELERLPAKDIQTNVYIKHPVSLEQVSLGGLAQTQTWGGGFLEGEGKQGSPRFHLIDLLVITLANMESGHAVVGDG